MFKFFKRNFVILAVAAVAVIALSPSMAVAKKADKSVAAVVNGKKIFKSDVLKTLKTLEVKKADTQKVYPVAVNQMVNEKLLEVAIKKSKIEQSYAYKSRMAEMKKQLLKSLYLKGRVDSKITDDKVKAKYDEIKKANAGKKEANALHILLKTEDEAKQVIKDLGKKGTDFSKLAKERSSDATAQNGGDVGFFLEGELFPAFSKATFALKKGKYTKKPVKTPVGWHVIYLKELRDRKVPEYAAIEQNIRAGLGQQAVDDVIKGLRGNAKVKLYDFDGKPLEVATKK